MSHSQFCKSLEQLFYRTSLNSGWPICFLISDWGKSFQQEYMGSAVKGEVYICFQFNPY